LPSSFNYKWPSKDGVCSAQIYYACKVVINEVANEIMAQHDIEKVLKDKFEFIVNSSHKVGLQTKIEKEFKVENYGQFKMTTYLEKDSYVPGETVYVIVETENNSKKEC